MASKVVLWAACALVGYAALSFLLLFSLDAKDLIVLRMYQSREQNAEPIPMPALLKDLYWELRGRREVMLERCRSESIAAFPAFVENFARLSNTPIDQARSIELLGPPSCGAGHEN